MTKVDKIKICREFMRGEDVFDIEVKYALKPGEADKALRWGLKHPTELRK